MAKIGNINVRDFPLLPAPQLAARDSRAISGNGYRCTPEEAVAAGAMYGVEGIMTGRAAAGYPWIFNEIRHFIRTGEHLPPPTVLERVRVCKKQLHQSIAWKGDVAGILETRRHYTNYLKGLPHIKDFRQQLVTCNSLAVTEQVLDTVAVQYKDHIFERTTPLVAKNKYLPASNEMVDCNVYG